MVIYMTEIVEIELNKIIEGSQQTRKYTDPKKIDELAEDIKINGLLQPITVRTNRDRYEIVCGHRRYEAHKKIGAKNIQCIIREMNNFNAFLTAVRENTQREDLTLFDEAKTYQKFLDMSISQRKLARLLNISQTKISQALNINRLPDGVEKAVISQLITSTHAQELLKLVRFMDEVGFDEISQFGVIAYKIDDIIIHKQSVGDLRYSIDDYICGFIDVMCIMKPERVCKSRGSDVEFVKIIKEMQEKYKDKIPHKYIVMAFKFHAKHGDFNDDYGE